MEALEGTTRAAAPVALGENCCSCARMQQVAARAEQGSWEGAGDAMLTKWGQAEELGFALGARCV